MESGNLVRLVEVDEKPASRRSLLRHTDENSTAVMELRFEHHRRLTLLRYKGKSSTRRSHSKCTPALTRPARRRHAVAHRRIHADKDVPTVTFPSLAPRVIPAVLPTAWSERGPLGRHHHTIRNRRVAVWSAVMRAMHRCD